jgi:hypothetical protein
MLCFFIPREHFMPNSFCEFLRANEQTFKQDNISTIEDFFSSYSVDDANASSFSGFPNALAQVGDVVKRFSANFQLKSIANFSAEEQAKLYDFILKINNIDTMTTMFHSLGCLANKAKILASNLGYKQKWDTLDNHLLKLITESSSGLENGVQILRSLGFIAFAKVRIPVSDELIDKVLSLVIADQDTSAQTISYLFTSLWMFATPNSTLDAKKVNTLFEILLSSETCAPEHVANALRAVGHLAQKSNFKDIDSLDKKTAKNLIAYCGDFRSIEDKHVLANLQNAYDLWQRSPLSTVLFSFDVNQIISQKLKSISSHNSHSVSNHQKSLQSAPVGSKSTAARWTILKRETAGQNSTVTNEYPPLESTQKPQVQAPISTPASITQSSPNKTATFLTLLNGYCIPSNKSNTYEAAVSLREFISSPTRKISIKQLSIALHTMATHLHESKQNKTVWPCEENVQEKLYAALMESPDIFATALFLYPLGYFISATRLPFQVLGNETKIAAFNKLLEKQIKEAGNSITVDEVYKIFQGLSPIVAINPMSPINIDPWIINQLLSVLQNGQALRLKTYTKVFSSLGIIIKNYHHKLLLDTMVIKNLLTQLPQAEGATSITIAHTLFLIGSLISFIPNALTLEQTFKAVAASVGNLGKLGTNDRRQTLSYLRQTEELLKAYQPSPQLSDDVDDDASFKDSKKADSPALSKQGDAQAHDKPRATSTSLNRNAPEFVPAIKSSAPREQYDSSFAHGISNGSFTTSR